MYRRSLQNHRERERERERDVGNQLGGSNQRPVYLTIDRNINNVVNEFTRCIIQAAKEAIPKGAKKEYKTYWNNDLDKMHNELNPD